MSDIVNKPLAIFCRPDSPKPLHSRWGDTSISVPTDGSWNQYDNPHRHTPSGHYGPGFMPESSPSDRTSKAWSYDYAEDSKGIPTHITAVTRRNSLSLGALRPNRLSVRLASRSKHLIGETIEQREDYPSPRTTTFAYKPIHQDYASEASERAHTPRYRYIPTNGRYLEDISNAIPLSQSGSYHKAHSHDSCSKPREGRARHRESRVSMYTPRDSYHEDDRRSLRSSLVDNSDSSSSRLSCYGLPARRKATPSVVADRRRSSVNPMTLAMVPDPDELYE